MIPISAVLTFALLAALGAVGDVAYAEYYVSASTGSDATGEGTKSMPWATLGHALAEVNAGDIKPATVNVAGGMYDEKVTVADRINLYGGFDPSDFERDLENQTTCAVKFTCTGDCALDGFWVVGSVEDFDRGIVVSGSASISVVRCKLSHHAAPPYEDGGGVRITDTASAKFIECVITDNGMMYIRPAPSRGGGIWHGSDGTLEFVRCEIVKNLATHGGGIYAEQGSIICRDCVFTHNSASWGASIHATGDASVTLVNCRFTDNTVFEFNWIETHDIYVDTTCTMTNCTLANTRGTSETASIRGAVIQNCILRGPDVGIGGTVSYSNVENYSGGVGNIDVEPEFVNAAAEDYRLLLSSPCIDMGTDFEAPDHDLDGNPRPVDIAGQGFDGPGQGYDMGCYEYVPPSPTPTPTPRPEDLNRDGKIDALDLYIFSLQWQRGANPNPPYPP